MEFEFFDAQSLSAKDFDANETQWAYEGLLAKQAITTIYAKSGAGKSYLALALSKAVAPSMRMVCYVDLENRISELERRGVNKIIAENPQYRYLHRVKLGMSRHELIAAMARLAKNGYYKDTLIILDGVKHFVPDVENDRQVREMMARLLEMRDDGATILSIHHVNKSAKNYQGSKELIDGSDNVFFAVSAPSPEGYIALSLGVEKMRDPIIEQCKRVALSDLEISDLPAELALMSEGAKEIAQAILKVLPSEGISQSKICEALGRDVSDKTVIAMLKQYGGILWARREGKRGQSTAYCPLNSLEGEENTKLSDGSRSGAVCEQKSLVKSLVAPQNDPDLENPILPANRAATRSGGNKISVKSGTEAKTAASGGEK
jgi:hypothetical protein